MADPSGADTILITKEIRTEWMDLMALDAGLSNWAFRIACIISTHFNNRSGETWLTKEKIAELSGGKERTVWTALNELETKGYLLVNRRQIGTRKDGRPVYGGKGVANTYSPSLQSSPLSASNKEKLAKIRDLKKEYSSRKSANYRNQSSQDSAPKLAENGPPTLTDPTDQYSSGRPARDPSGAPGRPMVGLIAEVFEAVGKDKWKEWHWKGVEEAPPRDLVWRNHLAWDRATTELGNTFEALKITTRCTT